MLDLYAVSAHSAARFYRMLSAHLRSCMHSMTRSREDSESAIRFCSCDVTALQAPSVCRHPSMMAHEHTEEEVRRIRDATLDETRDGTFTYHDLSNANMLGTVNVSGSSSPSPY